MPLTKKGRKILANMKKKYGDKKGEEVFYASINKGTITGAEEGKKHPHKAQEGVAVTARSLIRQGMEE